MPEVNLLDRGLELHQAGRLDEAARVYQTLLQTQPDHPDALHLLGTIALQQGDAAQAWQLIARAVALAPNQAVMRTHLGLALLRLERLEEAAQHLQRAVELNPHSASAHDTLGTIFRHQGRYADALACHTHAITIDPGFAVGYYNRALVQREQDNLQAAIASLRRALELAPNFHEAHNVLAQTLTSAGQFQDALPWYEVALSRAPNDAALLCGLADTLHALKRRRDSLAVYERALQVKRDLVPAWWGLGCAQLALGIYASAASSFRQLVQLAPKHAHAWHNLGNALYELGQIDRALETLRHAGALLGPNETTLGVIATIVPGSAHAEDRTIREARAAWADLLPQRARRSETSSSANPSRPLRLGYVSSFFQDRNWMKPVWGVINHHDRTRFQIHLFSDAPRSAIQQGYQHDPRDQFHDISPLSNEEVAREIETNAIDILVDLNGYSSLKRLALFALRAAPVQVAWFNLYATSGMTCLDYLLADDQVVAPGEETHYTEQVIRLPACYLTFEVTYPVPDVEPPPCLERGALTFGCLAPQYKITPTVLVAWAQLLQGSPSSRLLLRNRALAHPENRDAVAEMFVNFGVDPRRVDLLEPCEHFDFLKTYSIIDLALDTFPYNGGTTTMEALWQGVPVLTFRGTRWAGRIGASLLHHAGLAEFVAPHQTAHVEQARALARDPETPSRLATLRQTMRDRLRQAPVCDTARFTRLLEQEYQRIGGRG